jgi:hypothetical protein
MLMYGHGLSYTEKLRWKRLDSQILSTRPSGATFADTFLQAPADFWAASQATQ